MKEPAHPDVRRLALIDCFAKATWIALSSALVCLSIDGYAIFEVPHPLAFPHGMHGVSAFAIVLWTLEITIAVLALWLVGFAFSRPPRFLRQP